MTQAHNPVNIENKLPRYSGDARPLGFSYFCRFDEVTGVVACPGKEMPSLVDSSYIGRENINEIFASLER